MKKFLLPVILLVSVAAHGQAWLDFGARAGYNSTWLINQNHLDDKNVHTSLSGGVAGGIKMGLNFNQQYSLAIEGMYTQVNHSESAQGLSASAPSANSSYTAKLSYIDIPLIFRNSIHGTYLELGPQLSLLNSATINGADAKGDFQKTSVAAVFGFGSYIASFNDNLYLTLGFRATYGITDILSTGAGTNYQPLDLTVKSKSYTGTHPLTLGFHLELDFDLGYLVSAHCGRKQFLLFD